MIWLLACCVAACVPYASERNRQTEAGVLKNDVVIGRVDVAADPYDIPAPYRNTLALYGVRGKLRSGVVRRLRQLHRYDADSDVSLHVKITDFTLRPDVVALLPLPLLGIDRLKLAVTVQRGNRVVASFTVQGCFDQGGLISAIGRARRLALVIEAASFRLLAALYGRPALSAH